MNAPPQRTTYALSPPVRELIVRNREHGHVHVMSAYRTGLGASPRQQLHLLWHIDAQRGLLAVQADEPPVWAGKLGEVQSSQTVEPPLEGSLIGFVVERSCLKTPPSRTPEPLRVELERRGPDGKKLGKAYRSRTVIVPDAERPPWAAGRLAAIGLEVQLNTMQIGEQSFANLGAAKRGIPHVEIRGHALVTNAAAFADALRNGTGKGRNYGLGLIRIQPLH